MIMQVTNLRIVFDLEHRATVVFAAGGADFVRGLIGIAVFTANQMPQRQSIV
jgi:hypothetical protein